MNDPEYLVSRRDDGKAGYYVVTVPIKVRAVDRYELLHALIQYAVDQEMDIDAMAGIVSWKETTASALMKSFAYGGVVWTYEERLLPTMAAIYVPHMVIPPAWVLDLNAVVYGAINDPGADLTLAGTF